MSSSSLEQGGSLTFRATAVGIGLLPRPVSAISLSHVSNETNFDRTVHNLTHEKLRKKKQACERDSLRRGGKPCFKTETSKSSPSLACEGHLSVLDPRCHVLVLGKTKKGENNAYILL